ncbi:lasso peptide biosynthesis PqqD family chaperone [Metabacillus sp. JX24]|uniref:lasso peptide biosynthesis PqqD family chaperone n=1 Tax=Metabacillus sp. JX24 TaxID=3240759 RepID=UPI00351092B6
MSTAAINNTQFTVSQTEGNLVSNMNGEKVMLSVKNGKYYNLGEMGGIIWDLINKPIHFSNLIELLTAQYQVEKEVCEAQVLSFLEELNKENLVKINLD